MKIIRKDYKIEKFNLLNIKLAFKNIYLNIKISKSLKYKSNVLSILFSNLIID